MTVVRSISDAVEPPSAKWRQQQFSSQPQRGNCFLRRPEVLETVYSVEEDGDGDGGGAATTTANPAVATGGGTADSPSNQESDCPPHSRRKYTQLINFRQRLGNPTLMLEISVQFPLVLSTGTSHSYKADSNSSIDDTPSVDDSSCSTTTGRQWGAGNQYASLEVLTDPGDTGSPRVVASNGAPHHVTTYNRVMSNHRSVTKPKDVKYKRINKAKSKSLEELRGRLRNWVDKGITSNKFISLDQSYA